MQNFEAWIGLELPEAVSQSFDQVSENSNFYISGLSMGGYGAFRIGINYPEKFRGISGHSSITCFDDFDPLVEEDWEGSVQKNHFQSIQELILEKSIATPFRFDCGLEDPLLNSNRDLHSFLNNHNIPHEYSESKGGHEWDYWNRMVRESYLFFDGIERGSKLV